MAIYLVDYENVKTGGLNGISLLTEADRVIIFYSENANRLTFDLHQRLTRAKAAVEYREVLVGGHNALDFQLVTYLGYLLAQDPQGHYLIISNDRGFEYVVNFWRKEGRRVGLLSYLKDPAIAVQRAMHPQDQVTEKPAPAAEPEETETVEFVAPSEEKTEEQPAEPTVAEPVSEEVLPPVEEVPTVVEEQPAEPAKEPLVVTVKPSRSKSSRSKKSAKPKTEAPKPEQEPEKAEEVPAPVAVEEPKPEEAKPTEEAPKETKQKQKSQPKPKKETPKAAPVKPELRALLGESVADDIELRFVENAVEKYKTKLGLNNALVKKFGNQKAGEIYQKLKSTLTFKKAN